MKKINLASFMKTHKDSKKKFYIKGILNKNKIGRLFAGDEKKRMKSQAIYFTLPMNESDSIIYVKVLSMLCDTYLMTTQAEIKKFKDEMVFRELEKC